MPYLSCKKIENDVYNFPTWQYCKYKDIFDSRIIINSTAKFYISISYQKDLLSIDTRIFTPSLISLCAIITIIFIAFAAMNGEYLTWDFNDPELAIVGTLLHGFEFLFIRLAPFLLTGSIIGIVFTYKKR